MFRRFVSLYDETNRALKKRQFLTCYFIAAYPGCTMEDMHRLKLFVEKDYRKKEEQKYEVVSKRKGGIKTDRHLTAV